MENKIIDKLDQQFVTIANWAIKNRILVMVLSFVALIGSGYFVSKLQFDGSIEGYFPPSDPVYKAYKEYQEDFRSDEVAFILYRVPDKEHGPFDIDALRTVSKLTQTLEEEVPFVDEVTSLANVEFMRAEGDTLIVDDLLIDFPNDQNELLEIKKQLMSKPAYINYLINEQGNYGAIFVEMTRTLSDPLDMIIHDPDKGTSLENLYPQISDKVIQEILARPEFSDSGIEFFTVGDVPMNSLYNRLFMADSAKISLLAMVLISAISWVFFRTSLAGLLAPMSVVMVSIIMMVGVIGFMGWEVGVFITMAPTLICAIGVAQTVHILQEYQRSLALQGNKNRAVVDAIKKVGAPCLMAAVTTAFGFLILSISDLEGLAQFGIYCAIGVVFTFLLSITLLVVFLAGPGEKPIPESSGEITDATEFQAVHPLIKWIVESTIALNLRHPRTILLVFSVVFIWSFIGLSKLSVDFNFLDEFKDHVQWKQDTILADDVLGGVMGITYIIDTQYENGIKNVDLLKSIESLRQYAESFPEVKKTFSVTDIVKDLNRSFNGDDPAFYTIPDSQDLVAQYLLVYEISGGEKLPELVSQNFSRTVVELRVAMSDASRLREIIGEINDFIANNPLPNASARPTGMGYLYVRVADYIGETQIMVYSLTFVVALVMCLAFGSFKIGLLSMIPNLTPIVITLGAMGWLGVSLDYFKLMLASIAIGIAVDDTIHMMTRFRSRFYQLGNYREALIYSLRDVGPAMTITTFILIGGFTAYLISDLAVLAHFGILLGATIGFALLADLLLMPAMLLVFQPFGTETQKPRKNESVYVRNEPRTE